MEFLTTGPRAGARRLPQRSAQRQRGDILLVVMVFLLVCLLGLVVSLRDNITSTLMGGNNLQRQRNVQVSDVATRQLVAKIAADAPATTLQLSSAAVAEPWYRQITAYPTAAPDAAYWDACLGNTDTALRCGSFTPAVNGTSLGYTVLAVVQYTGRKDADGCPLGGGTVKYTAYYYDLFLHVKEANGVTSSNTETVYRLCVPVNGYA